MRDECPGRNARSGALIAVPPDGVVGSRTGKPRRRAALTILRDSVCESTSKTSSQASLNSSRFVVGQAGGGRDGRSH